MLTSEQALEKIQKFLEQAGIGEFVVLLNGEDEGKFSFAMRGGPVWKVGAIRLAEQMALAEFHSLRSQVQQQQPRVIQKDDPLQI